ncbi:hypothetical protein A0J61_10840 [Choanephora cucurbitarum]|uniref:Uncharacterized protein n=1 Tax=Choanephora cucurbitarum TaxID=101091 RepID=A0A1C7MW99_9FUNG|nr:hypothetical protein A0J61_10840 [Choanephora cucurbitarum]
MQDDSKWKLKDGTLVEDILYNYAIELDYERYAAHSFIIDLEDEDLKTRFTETQWKEISNSKSQVDDPFSKKATKYFDKIASCGDFKTKYKVIKDEDFDPYEEQDEEWLQRSLLEFHSMYRQNIIRRIADRGSEKDLIVRLWRFFDNCFDSIDVETRREVACVATKTNNTSSTPSQYQVQRATKPDLILTKNSVELGSGENGRYTGSACNDKEVNEKKLKNPKTMKNMLNVMIQNLKKKQLANELEVVGFCHFHLKAELSVMDVPGGYVCRLRRFEELKVPEDEASFCSVFPLLSLALIAKNIVKKTLDVLEQDANATSYVARPSSQIPSLVLPPTMSSMSVKQRTE